MHITRCPTAWASGTGAVGHYPVSDADREQLQAYEASKLPKPRVITDKMREHYARLHEYSSRTRTRLT